MTQSVQILDHGKVCLIDWMGSDQRIVEAARVSYKSASKGPEQDAKLMRYLFTHGHWTPFEQAQLTFYIKAPIFVLRQLMRHRSLHWNETSARYRKMPEEFYVPELFRRQAESNKQSSFGQIDQESAQEASKLYREALNAAHQVYQKLLGLGVCREQARAVLPVALYSEVYVTGDLRNLMSLFYLRTAPDAQWETRQVAEAMVNLTRPLFPQAMQLWDQHIPRMISNEFSGGAWAGPIPEPPAQSKSEQNKTFQQASNMVKACCANKPKPKSDRMRWRETWSQKWGVVWQLVWKGRVVSEVKKDQRGDWALWINYGALSDDAPANYEMHRANGCDEAKGMARKAVRDFLRSLNEQKASGQ